MDLYSQLLDHIQPPPHAPLSSQVLAARGTARLRLKRYQECLKDVALALYAQDDCKVCMYLQCLLTALPTK